MIDKVLAIGLAVAFGTLKRKFQRDVVQRINEAWITRESVKKTSPREIILEKELRILDAVNDWYRQWVKIK